jgi:hypothetical protein
VGTGEGGVLVRGSALWARAEWVRVHHGEDGLKALLPNLPAAGRNLIHAPIDRSAWHSYALFLEFSIAIDRKYGQGDGSLLREIGRWSCHQSVPTLYKMFIRLGSVDFVLGKAGDLWGEHFNQGRFEAHRQTGRKLAFGTLHDFPRPHLAHCYAVLGFSMGCIELSGAENVRGQMVSCRAIGAETCVARIVWGDEPV